MTTYVTCDTEGYLVFLTINNDFIYIRNTHPSQKNIVKTIKNTFRSVDDSTNIQNKQAYNDVFYPAYALIDSEDNLTNESLIAFTKYEGKIGDYNPRIWRGLFSNHGNKFFNDFPGKYFNRSSWVSSRISSKNIYSDLENIFRFIEPNYQNLNTFSHKLREILIIACTEVECIMRMICDDNVEKEDIPRNNFYKTEHYFNLKEAMKLGEWSLTLKNYSGLQPLKPFELWLEENPTKSLFWYDAYNKVKHHREENIREATLLNVLNAVSAIHILNSAQYGPEIYSDQYGNEYSPFDLLSAPYFGIQNVQVMNYVSGYPFEFKPVKFFGRDSGRPFKKKSQSEKKRNKLVKPVDATF
ncbi:hypothetical protein [Gluconobacter kondonii]|uniref:Uncharacterized protein n=1 Tax=Gluconobacter kondonii TaxID=941463 RepID=A0ABQ5WWF4_9PROT|nr:hypothetical protein [Gluconobacter kondonii]GBR36408.1 hypothetical protein AA3266_2386 [Gluconobacter kondonii NBRC 3266]GLQ66944.1 hypothetical protein GCM10007870_25290 [Gluconobacter kondonii]